MRSDLYFLRTSWRAITQDQEKIFHKCADMLIEKNLHMKKNVAAVITKEILITFLWFHALFCLHRLKPVGRRGRFSLAAILLHRLLRLGRW